MDIGQPRGTKLLPVLAFMDQTAAKKVLQELVKNDNRVCCDCGNPNPQWASLGSVALLPQVVNKNPKMR
jgi:hypothetical protein